uniref:Turripeptide Lol11.2 n=1 Tax=Iotyrris olangoensis TaxID=2420066 RepID=TUB2_IOTOL|nr:RecName: Full=Turripeptide Lol11.2; AltName: Full=OL67; Flags: Precursor [Iotyrris olangoensis]
MARLMMTVGCLIFIVVLLDMMVPVSNTCPGYFGECGDGPEEGECCGMYNYCCKGRCLMLASCQKRRDAGRLLRSLKKLKLTTH